MRDERRAGAASPYLLDVGRCLDEPIDQPRVGQTQDAHHIQASKAAVQQRVVRMRVHRGSECCTPPLPLRSVDQPVSDADDPCGQWIRDWYADRVEERAGCSAATDELGCEVRAAGVGVECDSACPRGAAAMQRWRQRIEHGCSTENVTQAGVAQEHAVTDGQRQGSLQGEPHERADA